VIVWNGNCESLKQSYRVIIVAMQPSAFGVSPARGGFKAGERRHGRDI
jgi:hypothetical protein